MLTIFVENSFCNQILIGLQISGFSVYFLTFCTNLGTQIKLRNI